MAPNIRLAQGRATVPLVRAFGHAGIRWHAGAPGTPLAQDSGDVTQMRRVRFAGCCNRHADTA